MVIVVALLGLWLAAQRRHVPSRPPCSARRRWAASSSSSSARRRPRRRTVRPGRARLPDPQRAHRRLERRARRARSTGRSGAGSARSARRPSGRRSTCSAPPRRRGGRSVEAVDSGYFATIADVGFIGLVVLLALFGRLVALARRRDRRAGTRAGWVALALLAACSARRGHPGVVHTAFRPRSSACCWSGVALAARRARKPRSTAAAGPLTAGAPVAPRRADRRRLLRRPALRAPRSRAAWTRPRRVPGRSR